MTLEVRSAATISLSRRAACNAALPTPTRAFPRCAVRAACRPERGHRAGRASRGIRPGVKPPVSLCAGVAATVAWDPAVSGSG